MSDAKESARSSDTVDVTPEPHSRKVSFSDLVITSSQVEKLIGGSELVFEEEVEVVNGPDEDASGHHISVRRINPNDTEDEDFAVWQAVPLLHNSKLPVFVARLGMLKQATVYRVEFRVPDELQSNEVELLRYASEEPGQVSLSVNPGATVELISAKQAKEGGHTLQLELSTTRERTLNEPFTLRCVDDTARAVHLILHALSLGRGQGTPFLRLGIHRVGTNQDYVDSDDMTEWPGFVRVSEDEDETTTETPAAVPAGDD